VSGYNCAFHAKRKRFSKSHVVTSLAGFSSLYNARDRKGILPATSPLLSQRPG
jgi:hypothetical protein